MDDNVLEHLLSSLPSDLLTNTLSLTTSTPTRQIANHDRKPLKVKMDDTAEVSTAIPGSSATEASAVTTTQADEVIADSNARIEPAAGSNEDSNGISSSQMSASSAKDPKSPQTETTATGHEPYLNGEQQKRGKYRALRDLCKMDPAAGKTNAKSSEMEGLKTMVTANDGEVKVSKNCYACVEETRTNCMIPESEAKVRGLSREVIGRSQDAK